MEAILIILLIAMILCDFKYRYVYLWQLILFAIAQLIFCFLNFGQIILFQNLLINGLTILFISLLVKLYIYIRFRDRKYEGIGLGDIIFIFILTPYFSISLFLYFMIISLLFTLGCWLICRLIGNKSKDIPLISTLGICYCLFLIYNSIVA